MSHAVALYPGSFDPVTNGHVDIIRRASRLYDEVVVAVLENAGKDPLFSPRERASMLCEVIRSCRNVRVETFDGLLVDFARACGSKVVLRGIRAVTDLDYEFQMALMNRRLQPHLETVFMVPAEEYSYLSSSLVKEVSRLGGSVSGLVPDLVEQNLKLKIESSRGR